MFHANFNSVQGPVKLSWAHALFTAATVFNFLANPQIEAVLLHVLLNGFGWGELTAPSTVIDSDPYEYVDLFVPAWHLSLSLSALGPQPTGALYETR
jgi:hypothetical protein